MAAVVIVGAGIGGLATALLLGREGRQVIVCERDAAPVPGSTEDMWSAWPRPGTPQARLGHTFLPGFRVLLQERAPDVLQRVWAAGAPPVDFSADMPGNVRPEDAELTGIMCRRGVLEGIMRQAVEAEPTVELRGGCHVVGLLAEASGLSGVPNVTGVRTGDQGAIAAASIVLAGGRLIPVKRWLEAIGANPPVEVSEGCGFVTYTRYFRLQLRAGEDHWAVTKITIERDLGYMKYEIYGADRCTFCVELEVPVWDRELRCLHDPTAHLAAARALPEGPEWLGSGRSTPIGPVAAMGQERNVLRQFVREGRPLALGLHAIGDARCQTNSVYAWGSGMALAEAVALTDILAEHDGDAEAQALAFEKSLAAETAGRYELSSARDRACLRAYRGEPRWAGADDHLEFIETTVVPAASVDDETFRAVSRRDLQLEPVSALAENATVLERARLLAPTQALEMPDGEPGPTRETLLQVVGASPAA